MIGASTPSSRDWKRGLGSVCLLTVPPEALRDDCPPDTGGSENGMVEIDVDELRAQLEVDEATQWAARSR